MTTERIFKFDIDIKFLRSLNIFEKKNDKDRDIK